MFSMDWEQDSPETLLDIASKYCVENMSALCWYEESYKKWHLREGISLSNAVCERLMQRLIESECNESYFYMFLDTNRTKIRSLKLRHRTVDISPECICMLLRHNLHELDLGDCIHDSQKSQEIIRLINKYSENLTVLRVSNYFLFDDLPLKNNEGSNESPLDLDYIFNIPKLKALSLNYVMDRECYAQEIIEVILKPHKSLVHLDLSGCKLKDTFEYMNCLEDLQNLTFLILYDVPIGNINSAFNIISKLKRLRVLDLGQPDDQPVSYENSEGSLAFLMKNLPLLSHLDLSGTNLAGFVQEKPVTHVLGATVTDTSPQACPIPGLEGRHLEFLGLLGCKYDACERENIPADKITGDANEKQIVLATQIYSEKKELLTHALNALFKCFRFTECKDQRGALEGILNGMRKWPLDKSVQICGSASMFYIVKGEQKHNLSTSLKRKIIKVLLTGMDKHRDEPTMSRNGCLTLCHFNIPYDVLFVYRDVVRILLALVVAPGQEEFVQRIGIYLLNSLACQVNGKEKLMVGDLGAMTTMLQIIRHKLSRECCDEVMEIAWSTMWNVTDETFQNCERFIDNGGMDIFLKCLEIFPMKEELLRNMMGLLGNVAEVQQLRCRLMKSEFVSVFSDLLESTSDGIEVSYNACGVLAHMLSDGEAAWTIEKPARTDVLARIRKAISRWELRTKRNINYRSFTPILKLLKLFDTSECQYWAVWALCNLTKMYRSKYCPILANEKGLPLLQDIVDDNRSLPQVRKLAREVLGRYSRYLEEPEVMTEDEMEIEEQ